MIVRQVDTWCDCLSSGAKEQVELGVYQCQSHINVILMGDEIMFGEFIDLWQTFVKAVVLATFYQAPLELSTKIEFSCSWLSPSRI